MLVKLSAILVILGTATLGEPFARGLCPKYCKCTYSGNSQGIAKCTTLDPEVQHVFPQDIRQLVVENDPNPKNITDSMFLKLGLKKLSTIKIVNSSVISLDLHAFNGLTKLTNVNLADNKLLLIHPDTFKNNTELELLVLSGNPLQLTQLLLPIGEYVLRSNSLTELYLSRCGMSQLSKRAFSELVSLDVLDLSYNTLRSIDPEVFTGLYELEELNLSYNEFSYIPPNTFSNIEDLLSLNLQGNPLQTFNLTNLIELKELDLSDCKFTSLEQQTFEGVIGINKLNLSHNMIKTIDPDAFGSLDNLRYLDLSYNDLEGPLDKSLLETVANLETLSLTGNKKLKALDTFIGEFTFLYYYDISDCGLSKLTNKMFKGMYFLATLNVSNNLIGFIEANALSGLKHLKVLDLSKNGLLTLHSNVFSSNHEITKLYLYGNSLQRISAPVFRPLTKLAVLDLSYNMLSSLFNHTESLFMQEKNILGQLINLNVAGNFIKHIHVYNFASMVKLEVLDISENQIQCTNNFNRVIKWLSSHRILPNNNQFNEPTNMNLEDKIENYRRWMTMLDTVCPIDLKAFDQITSQAPRIKTIVDSVEEPNIKVSLPEDMVEDTEDFYSKHMRLNDDSRYEVLEMTEDGNEWPTLMLITVFCVFISVAFINIGLIMFFRARRNYSLVGYKSTFSGGPLPQSRFPLRKGQRNAYQKLYEDCSIPNTPIVKNGKRLSIIKLNVPSIFGSQTDVTPHPV